MPVWTAATLMRPKDLPTSRCDPWYFWVVECKDITHHLQQQVREGAGASRPLEGHQVVPRQRARGKDSHSLRDWQRRLDRGSFTRQRADEARGRGKRGDVRGSREARKARGTGVGDREPCHQETDGEDRAREAGRKVEGKSRPGPYRALHREYDIEGSGRH